MKKLKNTKQNYTSHIAPHTSQNGITLIALIITIIVMLILVGVTINVALNGGLFEKGEKAAFQTVASTVKEQLEMAKALKVMNAEGRPVNDYSDIIVGNLPGLDDETKSKYGNILVVNKNGDICYNPEKVTAEEKTWLEEIGIKAHVNNSQGGNEPTGTRYSFTLNDLGDWKVGSDGWIEFDANILWSKINNNLYSNEDYKIEANKGNWVLAVETDNPKLLNWFKLINGDTIEDETALLVVGHVLDADINKFYIQVTSSAGEEILTTETGTELMTYTEFMNTYGETLFTFVEISELNIPQ